MISWADQAHGLDIARTMGMVTFALFILAAVALSIVVAAEIRKAVLRQTSR